MLLAPVPTPAAAPGVQCLLQPRGKLESRRTGDHDPSAGADSLLPCSPNLRLAVKWSEHRHRLWQPAAAPGVRRLGSHGKSQQIRGDLSVS
ncbi:hypothetical protein NDU88_005929 [Pleurodeles waltl]|uniref:Uncharacterized protein n=1 Tax=Pleurodeles waltl TaxID=8319 RepID=A0AAV7X2Q2_PLEWA|nr:hypothetical protein NDU88_005929 [Pleurodeles waltl]